jgi:hypothetical protein
MTASVFRVTNLTPGSECSPSQRCVMQARECKRQADNCAAGIPTLIEENGGAVQVEVS